VNLRPTSLSLRVGLLGTPSPCAVGSHGQDSSRLCSVLSLSFSFPTNRSAAPRPASPLPSPGSAGRDCVELDHGASKPSRPLEFKHASSSSSSSSSHASSTPRSNPACRRAVAVISLSVGLRRRCSPTLSFFPPPTCKLVSTAT
ncbi:hypothetical protein EJB05_14458, partial [Eragrostis curvula]